MPTPADCFRQYGLITDDTGRYAAMYKPYHLIGLELNVSHLLGSPAPRADRLHDGLPGRRGGHGETPAFGRRGAGRRGRLHGVGQADDRTRDSLTLGGLPIGLAHGVTLKRHVAAGSPICWAGRLPCRTPSRRWEARQSMERAFREEWRLTETPSSGPAE